MAGSGGYHHTPAHRRWPGFAAHADAHVIATYLDPPGSRRHSNAAAHHNGPAHLYAIACAHISHAHTDAHPNADANQHSHRNAARPFAHSQRHAVAVSFHQVR